MNRRSPTPWTDLLTEVMAWVIVLAMGALLISGLVDMLVHSKLLR
jgi:hypothetical protein